MDGDDLLKALFNYITSGLLNKDNLRNVTVRMVNATKDKMVKSKNKANFPFESVPGNERGTVFMVYSKSE